MPPSANLVSAASSFTSSNKDEVVCPLLQNDGSPCRKRCTGDKRYRSILEHARRSHPDHYIPKLPATEESFLLMVNTPPRKPQPVINSPRPDISPNSDKYAAQALAQLHTHRVDLDWDSENDWNSDSEPAAPRPLMRSSIELPPMHHHYEVTSDPYSHVQPHRRKDLASILSASPPGRSSTLPPIQRHPNRPHKSSVSKRAKEPAHRRQKSRDHALLRRMSYDRKAHSAEPASVFSAAYGLKRWEDLIDAATSATEDVESERTTIPPSPLSIARSSLPPNSAVSTQQPPTSNNVYQASPLQRALTPPTQSRIHHHDHPEPFPTIESSTSHESRTTGDQFRISPQGLASSSPSFSSTTIQIYCAACQGIAHLKESYACTECICGVCRACVDILFSEQGARRKCPRCGSMGGKFKPFQLDFR